MNALEKIFAVAAIGGAAWLLVRLIAMHGARTELSRLARYRESGIR